MMLGMIIAGDLSDAERRVWDAFPTGSLVDFSTGNSEDDHPVRGEGWGLDRQVRAEVLAALLWSTVDMAPGRAAVNLRGARVTGQIDLAGTEIRYRMALTRCHIGDGILLSDARARTLLLYACRIGQVGLMGAIIEGDLSFNGTLLKGTNGLALNADRLTVTRSMSCDGGFVADGAIRLVGARVGGQLSFKGARLDGKGGLALAADGLTASQGMLCDEGFRANGGIRLVRADITTWCAIGRPGVAGVGRYFR